MAVASVAEQINATALSTSGSEFEGFNEERNYVATERLNQLGIGDDDDELSDVSSVHTDILENFDARISSSESESDDGAGDQQQQQRWSRRYHRNVQPDFTPLIIPPGPTTVMHHDLQPIDFMKLFVSDETLDRVVLQTNLYARQRREAEPDKHRTSWIDVTVEEFRAFLGLCFLMGVIDKPQTKQYWSTSPLLNTPYFPEIMTRDRFTQIMRYIHFVDNSRNPNDGIATNDANYDTLWKVRWILDALNSKFKSEYVPKQNISIDETMIPFKGMVHFKQYLPAKPTKWGIKAWCLAESDTGYVSQFIIYTGKQERAHRNLSHHVVIELMQSAGLLGRGYKLFVDNFYTAVDLFTELWEDHQTAACGTVRINRRGLPRDIIAKKPAGLGRERGEYVYRYQRPILAIAWRDKRVVFVLSTIHDVSNVQVQRTMRINNQWARQDVQCPLAVDSYIKYMGGVDLADQYIQYYSFGRKTRKWTLRLFFKMLEICKLNAYKLYIASPNHQLATSDINPLIQGNKPLTFLQFTLKVVEGLIAGYRNPSRKGRPSLQAIDDRLTTRCMPHKFVKRSWCHVCWMKNAKNTTSPRSQTLYGCATCGKHMCIPTCFIAYHSKVHYY